MKKMGTMVGILMLGFTVGILLPNILWKYHAGQGSYLGMTVLSEYWGEALGGEDYFWYVVSKRAPAFMLCILFGISIFGVPSAILAMACMGFAAGGILTLSLLELGLRGLLLGGAMLFPHYLLYVPVGVVLFSSVYHMSLKNWKNEKITGKDRRDYLITAGVSMALWMVAVYMESHWNLIILQTILKKLKFF